MVTVGAHAQAIVVFFPKYVVQSTQPVLLIQSRKTGFVIIAGNCGTRCYTEVFGHPEIDGSLPEYTGLP